VRTLYDHGHDRGTDGAVHDGTRRRPLPPAALQRGADADGAGRHSRRDGQPDRPLEMGARTAVGGGRTDRGAHDQRPGRNAGRAARVPAQTVHFAGGRVLRMEKENKNAR